MRGAGLRAEGGGGRQGRSAQRLLAVDLCAMPGWLGWGFAASVGGSMWYNHAETFSVSPEPVKVLHTQQGLNQCALD